MPLPWTRSLSPARRRLFRSVVALAAAVVAAVVVGVVVTREPPVTPVPRDRAGPVLLVPGYGGSTTALEVLAAGLVEAGDDARVVAPLADPRGDLRAQARALATEVDRVLAETGAPSVDLVGYSAGGVVVRLYVADLGGGSTVRRAITLASPHHGTDLAALGAVFGTRTCPVACQQLAPDSDLLRRLNAGDETPAGPDWVAVWTTDDGTVVPPVSGALDGAVAFPLQSVCPTLTVEHPDVPSTPAVIGMVEELLEGARPAVPGPSVCER